MSQPNRLPADAARQFGGTALDRGKALTFRVDGRRIEGFAGDTVVTALLANGIDTYGTLGDAPLGLTPDFVPLTGGRSNAALPLDRLAATEGLDLMIAGRRRGPPLGQLHSLHRDLSALPKPPWIRAGADERRDTELLVIGGGVAGLSAAAAAATAGHKVILIERRPWLGGDARYFGAVGDEETPEALTARLIAELSANPNVMLLTAAEAFSLHGQTALVHAIDGTTARIVAITAPAIVLATGATERLPVFPGNRLPGVLTSTTAYHLAKRYGIVRGRTAVVATQSNHGYRLALRLHDAGVGVRRVADTRVNPQSRFVDFAKASGLTLATGQYPLNVTRAARGQLKLTLANTGGTTPDASFEASQIIVGGIFQPELTLWMRAGGGARWSPERHALVAAGRIGGIVLVGSAAGYRAMRACADSGRVAAGTLFGTPAISIEDVEPGTHLETPPAATPNAPELATAPSFFSAGASLACRPSRPHTPSMAIGDVAAAVELGLMAPGDAGAIAEERGAPGEPLTASTWTVPPQPQDPVLPAYLAHRFGGEPQRLHLVVDHKRKFEIGALVYSNSVRPDPQRAIGVIVEAAPIGGIALVTRSALKRSMRFIVETHAGPSPARPAAPVSAPPASEPVS